MTRAARVDLADRGGDVGVRHRLEQVRLRAGVQRAPDVLVAVVGREHDEAESGDVARIFRIASTPLRPGRRRSISTTSAARSAQIAQASSPEPASPATAMSGCRRMIAASPNRTTG